MEERMEQRSLAVLKEQTEVWISRFAPLVLETSSITPDEAQDRLELIKFLREDVPNIRERIDDLRQSGEHELAATFESAANQLDSIESEHRLFLGRVIPGDPGGVVDLDKLRDRLEDRQARVEVGLGTHVGMPEVLEMQVAAGNLPSALVLASFAFVLFTFTILHASIMIGGMYRQYGSIAYLLFLFYSLFLGGVLSLFLAALKMASLERIRLDGRELTVYWELGRIKTSKRYTLAPGAEAVLDTPVQGFRMGTRGGRTQVAVILHDVEQKPISLSLNAPASLQIEVRDKINGYLKAYG